MATLPHTTSPFLTAEWRTLLMFNYAVNPDILKPFVPSGLYLDEWHGKAYVSLVGFMFTDTKLLGIPIPFHRKFEEVNLRFYVRRDHPTGVRRGVIFVKEIVSRSAITLVARLVYNENYVTMKTDHRISPVTSDGEIPSVVEYGWRRGKHRWRMCCTAAGTLTDLVPNSEEEFITEHYWGYTRQRNGSTMEYAVHHPRWRVGQCQSASVVGDFSELYGKEFGEYFTKPPTSALYAEGSAVTVFKGQVLQDAS